MNNLSYRCTILFMMCLSSLAEGQHIADFISVAPGNQTQPFRMPSTHTFQYLIEAGDPLTVGGVLPGNTDFTGYVPQGGSSTVGWLGINAETTPGEMSILNLHFDNTQKKWLIDASGLVDFTSVEGTRVNCSGGITPWGTILTCEESKSGGSTNTAGYFKYGYCIEVDVVNKVPINYPGGLPNGDKIWKMAYGGHENACVHANNRTLYTGLDETTGYLYKYVTDVANDLSAGKLYVLTKSSATTGQWKRIQNATVAEVNSTPAQSAAVGGAVYNGIEDVEIGQDGKIYFAVKNEHAVYRFTDTDYLCASDSSITNFETFVGGAGASYQIATASGTVTGAWGTGNDNLAFDNLGNLWVFQDGSNNAIWVVSPTHTQASPQVRYFGNSPLGSEPTGITFTPDYKYIFMSFQHPNATNNANQLDAFGIEKDHNKATSMVLARSEFLGGVVFPTELVAFEVKRKDKAAWLTWRTVTETESAYFHVERLSNQYNGTWETIATLPAAGNSTKPEVYEYVDEYPLEGTTYYRLRQEDKAGEQYYSDMVTFYQRERSGLLFPNPLKDGLLHLQMHDATAEVAGIYIINTMGQVVYTEKQAEISEGQLDIRVENLTKGLYFLQIQSNGQLFTLGKFMVE